MTNPWFKFYPNNWKADNQLRLCSAAARGLWIEMLCICHHATPYGHLLIDGSAPTETELNVLTGIPVEQILTLTDELSSRGIFSRTSKGVIYSRKMVSDEKRSREGKRNGKTGGNPSLSKDTEKSSTLKGKDKTRDKTKKKEERIKDYYFSGKVVRLSEKDFLSLNEKSGMTHDGFGEWLSKKDEWLITQPEHERADWWYRINSHINNMRGHDG